MNTLKKFLTEKINLLLYAPAKFKKGDAVQCIAGGALMVILNIKHNADESRSAILCQWYDREQKLTLQRTFLAAEIKLFDWYHPV